MHIRTFVCLAIAAAATGCTEPHNVRMRLAALVPGSPEHLIGVDGKDQVLLCDSNTLDVVRVVGAYGTAVRELRVSSAGTYVASVGADGRCRIADVASGQTLATIRPPGAGDDCGAAAFSASERLVVCGGTGVVEVWSLPGGALVRRIPDADNEALYGSGDFEAVHDVLQESRVLSLDVLPTGPRVLVGTDRGIFEIDYVRCVMTWRQAGEGSQGATFVRYAPSGQDFVMGTPAGTVDYFRDYKRAISFRPGGSAGRAPGRYATAEFTPDGAYLAILSTDGTFTAVRLADQQVLAQANPGKLDAGGIALSGDGRCAWAGSQGNVERFTRFALPEEMWSKPLELD